MSKIIVPIVKLKDNDTVQHHSGLLSKQLSKQDFVKNYQTYVYTHAHLYENAEQLKEQISSQGKIVKGSGSNIRAVQANIGGVPTIAFVSTSKKELFAEQQAKMKEVMRKKMAAGNTPTVNTASNTGGKRGKK